MSFDRQEVAAGSAFADRYRVVKLLGDGGMGKVYLAEDLVLEGERVALKLLRTDLGEDEKHVKRFIREVQLTRKIAHPNVVRTYDIAWHEGTIYFTMEYVEGITLRDRLQQGRLSPREAMEILLEVSRGLSSIHEGEIIHRDLKPGNIIITNSGIAKIADFGIARPSVTDITNQHEIVGSAGYMAPEAWTGATLDARTDIYALGVLTYEMIMGDLPFDGSSATEVMDRHLSYTPPALLSIDKEVPPWFSELVHRMVAKDPEDRPSSAQEIISIVELGSKQRVVSPQGKAQTIVEPSLNDTKDHLYQTRDHETSASMRRKVRDAKESFLTPRKAPIGRMKPTPGRNQRRSQRIDLARLAHSQMEISLFEQSWRIGTALIEFCILTWFFGGVVFPRLISRLEFNQGAIPSLSLAWQNSIITLGCLAILLTLPILLLKCTASHRERVSAFLGMFGISITILMGVFLVKWIYLSTYADVIFSASLSQSILSLATATMTRGIELLALSGELTQFLVDKRDGSVFFLPTPGRETISLFAQAGMFLAYSLGLTISAGVVEPNDRDSIWSLLAPLVVILISGFAVLVIVGEVFTALLPQQILWSHSATPFQLTLQHLIIAISGWGAFLYRFGPFFSKQPQS